MYQWTDEDMRHRPKLVLTALEVRRRHSEAMALDAADRQNYQRERKNNRDWLNWAIQLLRPIDEMTRDEAECFMALYDPPPDWLWRGKVHIARHADSKFWQNQPEALVIQGGKIVSSLW